MSAVVWVIRLRNQNLKPTADFSTEPFKALSRIAFYEEYRDLVDSTMINNAVLGKPLVGFHILHFGRRLPKRRRNPLRPRHQRTKRLLFHNYRRIDNNDRRALHGQNHFRQAQLIKHNRAYVIRPGWCFFGRPKLLNPNNVTAHKL